MNDTIRIAIPGFQAFENYVQAVKRTGDALAGRDPAALSGAGGELRAGGSLRAEAVLIGEDRSECGKIFLPRGWFSVSDFDGLVLPGGGDISPECYGEKIAGSEGIDEALDALQLSVLDDFVRAGKPVLGICRGHQLVNVYFGGTLIQDIPERAAHVRIGDADNVHEVEAESGSLLEALYGRRFRTNSSHHQATGRVGEGLRITARGTDGVVEAAEHTELPVMTVQFHPERMAFAHSRKDTVDGQRIFEEFLVACLAGRRQ